MDTKFRTFLAIALIGMIVPLGAQESGGSPVFAPYPSHLRVGVRNTAVLLTWEDSPDVVGGYVIYRHVELPTADNFGDAVMIGEASDGVGSYEYTPPDDGLYYYAVLGRSDSGVYEVFIPLRNSSLVGISVPAGGKVESGDTASSMPTAASGQSAAASSRALQAVGGISAHNDVDAIVVSFSAAENTGRLVLYRATEAIKNPSSILNAVVAALIAPGSVSFRDYPVPGIAYYYAVVPEKELLGGILAIKPGVNATTTAASVPAGSYRIGLPEPSPSSRSIPLPYLVLTKTLSTASPVTTQDLSPAPRELKPETRKAAATLVSQAGTPVVITMPKVTIFPEDLKSDGGQEYTLRSIITDYFAKGLYADAAEQLTLYLSLPRSNAVTMLAHFYRGQALALSGSWREAFFEFLRAQDNYYLESQIWMECVLAKIREG
ncbi:MAG: hypothetical protein E4H20_05695 [Spirochaetales bacterium]|nr:MAG: hypothetical protein E4H20_05695 [Spirochaetales bacterium]